MADVIRVIEALTGPTGGWLDSPRVVLGKIREHAELWRARAGSSLIARRKWAERLVLLVIPRIGHREELEQLATRMGAELKLYEDALASPPSSPGAAQTGEKCPSCGGTDNNPYETEYGVKMRACGRCVIQWVASSPGAPQETVPGTMPLGSGSVLSDHGAAMGLALSATYDALPEWARKFIHDIETRCDPAGDVRTIAELREQIVCLEAKTAELEKWKESQLAVTPDMQAIAKLLNIPLGASVHDKIIPAITELNGRLERLSKAYDLKERMEISRDDGFGGHR